jgi:hypothetical protein
MSAVGYGHLMAESDASPRRTVKEVVDYKRLEALWKQSILKRLRATRFPNFVIGHDPTEWASVEWEIDQIIRGLRQNVLSE